MVLVKETLEAKGHGSPEAVFLQSMPPYPSQACNRHNHHHDGNDYTILITFLDAEEKNWKTF